jgi:hypothetical protein
MERLLRSFKTKWQPAMGCTPAQKAHRDISHQLMCFAIHRSTPLSISAPILFRFIMTRAGFQRAIIDNRSRPEHNPQRRISFAGS